MTLSFARFIVIKIEHPVYWNYQGISGMLQVVLYQFPLSRLRLMQVKEILQVGNQNLAWSMRETIGAAK